MDFIVSSILGGILYDLVKEGAKKLTVGQINERMNYIYFTESQINSLLDDINKIKNLSEKIGFIEQILSAENNYTNMFETEVYKTNFAKRLDYTLMLINKTDYFTKKYNVENLAEDLGFESANDLKNFYITSEEPSFKFIDDVANKIGVNKDWMKAGDINTNVFTSTLPRIHSGMELFDAKDFQEVQGFIFAMEDVGYERRLAVVRRMNTIKYEVYPRPLIFYYSGGRAGASELYSVYKMLKNLNAQNKMPSEVYLLSEEKFNNLLQGKMYPGSVRKEKPKGNLLDDFIWISNERRESYIRWYGQTFVDAQDCVVEESNWEQNQYSD